MTESPFFPQTFTIHVKIPQLQNGTKNSEIDQAGETHTAQHC